MAQTAHTPALGWALVKPAINADEYMPVEILRKGKRFTFVSSGRGGEWRYSSRGLWDGFATEEDARAMLERMRQDRATFARAAIAKAEGRADA